MMMKNDSLEYVLTVSILLDVVMPIPSLCPGFTILVSGLVFAESYFDCSIEKHHIYNATWCLREVSSVAYAFVGYGKPSIPPRRGYTFNPFS